MNASARARRSRLEALAPVARAARLRSESAALNADPRARIWTRLEPWAALLAVAWCAIRLARGLGPIPFYNSDSAVPILLMQGLGDGPFTLYYPLQDRYGMWPFLIARAMHLATPEAFHVFSVLALCTAAVPLAMLLEAPALGAAALLVPLILNHEVTWNFFQSGQPYLWQVTTLIWAWAACRLAFEAQGLPRRVASLVALFGFGTLSIWISTFSIPALVILLVIETLRARATPTRIAGPLVAIGLSARSRRRSAASTTRSASAPSGRDSSPCFGSIGGT